MKGLQHSFRGVKDLVKSQLSKIRGLTNALLYPLEPAARIGTMNDAPQVAQAFGHLDSVIENIFLRGPRIIGEEHSHTFRFGEDMGRVTELGSLNGHAVLQVKDVFIAEQIENSSATGELLVKEGIIIRLPGNLGDVKITKNAERSADALKLPFLDGCLSDVSTEAMKRAKCEN
jgi:hypothetical protein